MILEATISIYCGGPGSGCRGDNCGRPSTGRYKSYSRPLSTVLKNPKTPIEWSSKWFRNRGEAPVRSLSQLVKQKPLASSEQNGYTMWIAHGVDKQENTVGGQGMRKGTFFVRKDSTGEVRQAGYWMDWPESNKMSNLFSYERLSVSQRASMELSEQKKWGFKDSFDFHKDDKVK